MSKETELNVRMDGQEITLTSNGVFIPTRLGLVTTGEATANEWAAFGSKIRAVEGAVQWLIGDWLNYGEIRYGETYAKVRDALGYEVQTIKNEKWLAGRFELSRRRDDLSWSHHAEVAGLGTDEADEMLTKAAENNWTREDLRRAVRKTTRSRLILKTKRMCESLTIVIIF